MRERERETEMGCETVNVVIRRKEQVVVVQALIEPNKEILGYIYIYTYMGGSENGIIPHRNRIYL